MSKAAIPTTRRGDPVRRQAVIYARVSSKEQEKEGFSIGAQLKLLKEYSVTQGFTVAQEYVDVENCQADRSLRLWRYGFVAEKECLGKDFTC